MLSRLRKNKDKKVSLAPQTPRSMEEIQKDYQQTAFAAGQAQYQSFVYEKEVEQLNQRLVSINREADARKKLDTEEAKTAAKAANEAEKEANEPKSQG